MNYLTHSIALHPEPRREVSRKRPGAIPPEPGAGRPPIAVRARRHSLFRSRAALSGRRRADDLVSDVSRSSAGSGVSPIASGASRGVTILIGR